MSTRVDEYREWLGAYHDGELSDERRAWVEAHLPTCPDCRQELAELRALSDLLQIEPAPLPSAARTRALTDAVLAQLPPAHPTAWQRILRISARYAPIGLFAAWAFIQAVIWVSGALLLGLRFVPGAQGALAALLPLASSPAGAPDGWLYNALGSVFDFSGLAEVAEWFSLLPWPSPLAFLGLALAVLLGVLFLAWLAGYWSYQRRQAQSE